jgi:transcriptional regulator with XRE-family HTH domain
VTYTQNPIDTLIGGKIQLRRLQLGWTLDQLAAKLDTTKQTVSSYEQGKLRVPASCLYLAAQVLGKPVMWFMGKEDGDA